MKKFPTNLEKVGNTSSASIPILLYEMYRKGMIENGSNIILCGFGAGLIWNSVFVKY